jgi:hypothetical protein
METLDKHFREITRAIFQRHGHAFGDVAARWPDIVGEDLARYSSPEKIKWPRPQGNGAKLGGTLFVRTAAGRALDVEYASLSILARVNGFLGYGAITAIRAIASPDMVSGREEPVPSRRGEPLTVDGFNEATLKQALERLGELAGIRPQGSPQDK